MSDDRVRSVADGAKGSTTMNEAPTGGAAEMVGVRPEPGVAKPDAIFVADEVGS